MAELIIGDKIVLVDSEDINRLSKIAWWITPQGYAVGKLPAVDGYRRVIGMHRFLLNDPSSSDVDHINRDKLDNQKANLRACTRAENCHNQRKRRGSSSCHRGVSWNKRRRKWQVVIRKQGKLKWLGFFDSEAEAANVANPYFSDISCNDAT